MGRVVKQVAITLTGTLTQSATRSFILEVPQEVDSTILDPHVLEDLADLARIPWNFGTEGMVFMTDHVIEDVPSVKRDSRCPVITLTPTHQQEEFAP